jgi:hypothetical protein
MSTRPDPWARQDSVSRAAESASTDSAALHVRPNPWGTTPLSESASESTAGDARKLGPWAGLEAEAEQARGRIAARVAEDNRREAEIKAGIVAQLLRNSPHTEAGARMMADAVAANLLSKAVREGQGAEQYLESLRRHLLYQSSRPSHVRTGGGVSGGARETRSAPAGVTKITERRS